ncbi:AraC family transcriptional regulator [Pseudomonas protegens]|uniref:AraC family transcriptional regulator n=1 Tax=Pseudomonas protegens TaxID=380021 RepID=UPI000F4BB2DD|nr:AraC family transcriptional regulator [Pseudomonas protegens]
MNRPPLFVRAPALTGFTRLVSEHGGDAQALLARVGMTQAQLDDAHFSLPLEKVAQLLEITSQTLSLADFGARLANLQDVSILGPLALIVLHASDLADALERVARYMPYHSPGLNLRLSVEGQYAAWHLQHDLSVSRLGDRQLSELVHGLALAFLRRVTHHTGKQWQINFRHDSPLDAKAYRALYGCRVRINQAENALLFPASLLSTPLASASPAMLETTERIVRRLIQSHPLDLGRQVEILVERLLVTGNCTLPVLAGQLGMPRHMLQRRLLAQGLRVEEIIDDLRRKRLESLLPHPQIALTEVAFLLGYGDPSSLTRACYRWFGQSPSACRQRHLAQP